MQRLLIALLSAFDALVAAVAGLAAVLAPVTVLWAIALSSAPWTGLWPTSATIWQLGHLVPVEISIPEEALPSLGIASDAATFVLSLAPLGFAAFTVLFAARSGRRAASAGSWLVGVPAGAVVYALIATLVWATGRSDIATVDAWQAIAMPALLYGGAALVGALVQAWNDGDSGIIDHLRERVAALHDGWELVPGLVFRGLGAVSAGLIGLGALGLLVAVIVRGPSMLALYESSRVDALGAVMFTLVNLAYLPTALVWALSWLAGPGFAVGVGTTVSPATTHLGVVPGLPMFGLIPETSSGLMLLVVLLPVAIGALAGWIVRSRFVAGIGAHEPMAPRAVITAGIALLSAAAAALLAAAASGSIGPDRLAQTGPSAGWLALAIGLEVGIGCAILMLAPRSHDTIDDAWLAAQPDD